MSVVRKFTLSGMHCVGCAMIIDEALENIAGIKTASAHYTRQVVEIEYDERQVTDEEIIAVIQDAGYTAAAIPLAAE